MMSAPRITPLARPTSEPTPDTSFSTKPPVTAGDAASACARASSSVAWSIERSCERWASAASTDAPISSVWSTTPLNVATSATVIRAISPSTISPAARLGLNLWLMRLPTTGLKITARTAANRSGMKISLTAASAVTTMTVAMTTPTKLHAHAPIFGAAPRVTGVSTTGVSSIAAITPSEHARRITQRG